MANNIAEDDNRIVKIAHIASVILYTKNNNIKRSQFFSQKFE